MLLVVEMVPVLLALGALALDIEAPRPGSVHVAGVHELRARRSLHDLGATISWRSELQGELGTGHTVRALLIPGLHRIRAQAGAGARNATVTCLIRPPQQSLAAYAASLAALEVEAAPASAAAGTPGLNRSAFLWFVRHLPRQLLAQVNITADVLTNPTDVNAVSGAGRLTAGVAARGALTLLRWPSPGHPDHVEYLATNHQPKAWTASHVDAHMKHMRACGCDPLPFACPTLSKLQRSELCHQILCEFSPQIVPAKAMRST